MDAAPLVFAPFLGIVWCVQRLFVKAPSGRQRVPVFAALKAGTHEGLTVPNRTSRTAETVGEFWRRLVSAHPGLPVTVILDNARYQRCALGQTVAATLGIEWLYVPTYAPNLNLIERGWKFVKKQCLYSKDYHDSASFQEAIMTCIEPAPIGHKAAWESFVTLRFQTVRAASVIDAPATCANSTKKKVLSKAA
jgi:hypothetical protein